MRDAILRAAYHIEHNPEQFDFHGIDRPNNCDTPGCALGWIGFFANIDPSGVQCIVKATATALGTSSAHFYDVMDTCAETSGWIDSAQLCAKGLRAYADKYFPANS